MFRNLRGVASVVSGYAGGTVERPTYEQVCTGSTGHAEAVLVSFDPAVVSYKQLVELFFLTHDPTTKNRQGNDVGSQYRSAIFTYSVEQERIATAVKLRLEHDGVFRAPIVTEITPFTSFYPAEEYHQNFYAKNPDQAYCAAIIDPKIAKLRKTFAHLLKTSAAESP